MSQKTGYGRRGTLAARQKDLTEVSNMERPAQLKEHDWTAVVQTNSQRRTDVGAGVELISACCGILLTSAWVPLSRVSNPSSRSSNEQ